MVAKIEATIDPDSILGNRDIFLGIDGPLPWQRDLLVR